MEVLKKYGGAILTGAAALVVVIALALVFWWLTQLVPRGDASLPLLAIGGVVVLVLLLTAVAMMFSILNLTNENQAMGLPEGSIRAVIALSLIVLFAILSIFLYQNILTGGPLVTIANISDTERAQFIREHTNARDLQSTLVKDKEGEPLVSKDGAGQPIKNADGTPKYFYDISYRSTNAASDEFAKQLLVLLGTLMTAITSFYLGAGTVTSAVKAGSEAGTLASPPPTLSGIKPTSHSIATDGAALHLEISGANLNIITGVKIVKAGAQPIVGTRVGSSPTKVTCELDVSKATTGTWDVEVDDGGSKSAKLPGALAIIT
jgi:hypothetical protein